MSPASKKVRDELSAEFQVGNPDFCGVSMEEHEAFCAGFEAGYNHAVKMAVEILVEALGFDCTCTSLGMEINCRPCNALERWREETK